MRFCCAGRGRRRSPCRPRCSPGWPWSLSIVWKDAMSCVHLAAELRRLAPRDLVEDDLAVAVLDDDLGDPGRRASSRSSPPTTRPPSTKPGGREKFGAELGLHDLLELLERRHGARPRLGRAQDGLGVRTWPVRQVVRRARRSGRPPRRGTRRARRGRACARPRTPMRTWSADRGDGVPRRLGLEQRAGRTLARSRRRSGGEPEPLPRSRLRTRGPRCGWPRRPARATAAGQVSLVELARAPTPRSASRR